MGNKDLHNFSQELIENSSFIAWVKSDFSDNNDEWSAYIDDHIDKMDQINQAIKVVRLLEFVEKPVLDHKKLWDSINADTQIQEDNAKIGHINWKYIISGLAAACLIAVIYFRWMGENETLQTFKTSIAQKKTEAFPDGSAITLSANTEATYDAKNWVKERKVSMKGLAFFEVRKGSTFVVETDKGNVTVMGTSFSVDNRNDNFEVICKTGKVSVKTKDGQEKSLHAGDIAKLHQNLLTMVSMPKGAVGLVPWLDGGYTFYDEEFENVVTELENQFGVKVVMDTSFAKMKYTGYFKNNHLNDALFNITWPLKLKYKIEGKQVFLTKE